MKSDDDFFDYINKNANIWINDELSAEETELLNAGKSMSNNIRLMRYRDNKKLTLYELLETHSKASKTNSDIDIFYSWFHTPILKGETFYHILEYEVIGSMSTIPEININVRIISKNDLKDLDNEYICDMMAEPNKFLTFYNRGDTTSYMPQMKMFDKQLEKYDEYLKLKDKIDKEYKNGTS